VIPVDSEIGRINLLRSGNAHFAITAGNALYNLQSGIQDFANFEWGPQPIQMAWTGPSYLAPVTTKGHKDINTVADIKRKRVPNLDRKSGIILAQSMLAFGGLACEDVVKVPVPGYDKNI
jgi:TRAP-type uncharacterized transport system substrate-binding protein